MKTILIVDDEFSLVEALAEILTWEGYTVVSAPNGRRGLEQLEKCTPALVLLDYMMPVMDGLTTLRMMRARPAWRRLPVILMSAAPVNLPVEERGRTELLPKPFRADAMLALVERLTRDASSEQVG